MAKATFYEDVAAAEEAVALIRTASEQASDDFTRAWALTLLVLTRALTALGRTDEAMSANKKAANIAQRSPDGDRVLADSLAELTSRLPTGSGPGPTS